MPWRLLRRVFNIAVLLSALVVAPLMSAAHFSATLAAMLGDFADRYLPQSTLLSAQKKAHQQTVARERAATLEAKKAKARARAEARVSRAGALDKGNRILVRGSATMAVGLVPVVGLSADVYSLAEDYSDVCELLRIIDEMSASLGVAVGSEEESLYRQNYCHKPAEGMELLKQQADQLDWP